MDKHRHRVRGIAFCILTAAIFLAATSTPCRAAAIQLKPEMLQGAYLGPWVEIYEDTSGKLTIGDFTNGSGAHAFVRHTKETANFGYTKSVYWLRFTVANETAHDIPWFLEHDFSSFDYLELYVPDDAGGYRVVKGSNFKEPFDRREVKSTNFTFRLLEKPGIRTYYMRFQTDGTMILSLRAWSKNQFYDYLFNKKFIYGLFYGIYAIMLIINLCILIYIRNIAYLLYALNIFFFLIDQLILHGHGFQYLWPNTPSFNDFMSTALLLVVTTGVLFTRTYLQTRKKTPYFDKALIVMAGATGALAAVSLFLPYGVAIQVAVYAIQAFMLHGIIASILFIRLRSREAIFYTIAYAFMFIGGMYEIMKYIGATPVNFLSVWGAQIGTLVMAISLSLGLADRINSMRSTLARANRYLSSSERLSKERAVYLEGVVQTINDISKDLTNVSRDLNAIGDSFSSLAEEQAACSEQMSSSFEELNSSTEVIYTSTEEQKNEAEKTIQLIQLLQNAQDRVIESNAAVIKNVSVISDSINETENNLQNMIKTMNVINTGGGSISTFVSIIDDISDKINLLSLNAAIEAARAGEYGRGFAVVADEIGKLASATSDNSKEIAKEIFKIIHDIEAGTTIVNETKESTESVFAVVTMINEKITYAGELLANQTKALHDVITQSECINNLSKEIARVVNEQSLSMNETMNMIERLSEMSQEISLSSRDILKFTETIKEKSERLTLLIKDVR